MTDEDKPTTTTVSAWIGIPAAVGVKATVEHRWDLRSKRLGKRVSELAALEPSELATAAADQPELSDLLTRATAVGVTTSDVMISEALASLIARAFRDSAQIEPSAYLLTIVESLQPVDLRVLRSLSPVKAVLEQQAEGDEDRNRPFVDAPAIVKHGQRVNAAEWIVEASLKRLAGLGLINDNAVGTWNFSGDLVPSGAGEELIKLVAAADQYDGGVTEVP